MEQWAGIIMAAGEGRRMASKVPKPLHKVCGKEMIRYPVELLQALGVGHVVIVVSPASAPLIRDTLGGDVQYVIQPTAQGTGDAAALAVNALPPEITDVVVMGSDSPLVRLESVRQLAERHRDSGKVMTMLTAPDMLAPDLGRVVRDGDGSIVDLVEAADWQEDAYAPAEVNSGVYCFNRAWLADWLAHVEPSANGEKYLTSLVSVAADQGDGADAGGQRNARGKSLG